MAGWPVEVIHDHPQKAMFTYYRNGQVIVKDSNNSDWIYIIKSVSLSQSLLCYSLGSIYVKFAYYFSKGNCQVLKRLELRDATSIDTSMILGTPLAQG